MQEAERDAVKERIAAWKRNKEEQLLLQQHEEKSATQQDKRLKEAEQKRRQQFIRMQLEQWKKAEALVKEQMHHAENISRAKSADPVDLQRRRERDLDVAKTRLEHKEKRDMERNAREIRLKELERRSASESSRWGAQRDPSRLLATTNTFQHHKLSGEHLDEAERRRLTTNAHSAAIACSARDLQGCRRAIPVWRKPPS